MLKKKLGLIVNPIAGIGGRVGLKGSDGEAIQHQAFSLGAVPQALHRASQALDRIASFQHELEIITYPGEMGRDATRCAGLESTVTGSIHPGKTSGADTQRAARSLLEAGVDLILFAGGDGTARDIYTAIGEQAVVLGIPAGVKIHSGAFATNPGHAGDLALLYLQGKAGCRSAEVLDIDEQAVRDGYLSARLFGYLQIPFRRSLIQGPKSANLSRGAGLLEAIAQETIQRMESGWLYILGPGTTTRSVASALGLGKTLLGVDVIQDRKIIAQDINETRLLALLEGRKAKIILSPIGGQGFILGRGNQQISPAVIQKVGIQNLLVISDPEKINSLHGQPLLVDTGDPTLDQDLQGYLRVITGFKEEVVYRLSA
jgi:predicted polyphosphate/ATP-dependent NAD kinase